MCSGSGDVKICVFRSNSVKRETTIQNIASLCPSFYVFLVNTYRCPIRLFIPVWREEIMSLEGTTQGDPAAMGMYALSVVPLIKLSEKAESQVCQVWYADDGTGVGKLTQLKGWWDTLASKGPNHGYYTNARKTVSRSTKRKPKPSLQIPASRFKLTAPHLMGA